MAQPQTQGEHKTGIGQRLLTFGGRVDPVVAALLWLLIVVKVALAGIAPPVLFPDSSAYLSLAEGFRSGAAWITDGRWDGVPPFHTMRPPVPGLMLAWMQDSFGLDGGARAWLLLQTLASCTVIIAAWVLLQRWGAGRVIGCLYVLAAAFSPFTLFDLTILTDSLAAAGVCLPMIYLLLCMTEGRDPSARAIVLCGIAWAFAVGMRPPMQYFALMPLSIIAGMALVNGLRAGVSRRKAGVRATLAIALFLLPIMALVETQSRWNEARTGERFFTTLSAYNALWPSFNMARTGLVDPFTGDDPLSKAVREVAPQDRTYPAQTQVFIYMVEHHGWDRHRMIAEGRALAVRTALARPDAAIVAVMENLRPFRMAEVMFAPRHNLRSLLRLGPWPDRWTLSGSGEVFRAVGQAPGIASIGAALFLVGGQIYAALLFLIGFLGPPILLLRSWRCKPQLPSAPKQPARPPVWPVFCAWLFCWVILGAYGLVHMEDRLAMPAVPFGWLCGFLSVMLVCRWWRDWRQLLPPP